MIISVTGLTETELADLQARYEGKLVVKEHEPRDDPNFWVAALRTGATDPVVYTQAVIERKFMPNPQ